MRKSSEENSAKTQSDGTPNKRSSTLWSKTKLMTWSETERNRLTSWMAFMTTKSVQWSINWEKRKEKSKTRPVNSMTWSKSMRTWSQDSKKSSARERPKRILTSKYLAGCQKHWPRKISSTFSSRTKFCNTVHELHAFSSVSKMIMNLLFFSIHRLNLPFYCVIEIDFLILITQQDLMNHNNFKINSLKCWKQ